MKRLFKFKSDFMRIIHDRGFVHQTTDSQNLDNIFTDFDELHGDRLFGDDRLYFPGKRI